MAQATPDSRFQKNFYTDSELTKGSGKRTVKQVRETENDFFQLNYSTADPSLATSQASVQGSGANMSAPWGVSDIANGKGDSAVLDKKMHRDHNSQMAAAATLDKNQKFYEANPECRLDRNYHREAMMAEKNKPVPWGTLNDIESSPAQQFHGGKRVLANRGQQAPAPFATAFNDEFPGKNRRSNQNGDHGNQSEPQKSHVQSQITF